MSTTDGDRQLVDVDVQKSLKATLQRVLEHATPESWVAGGATSEDFFTTTARKRETLKERERIYRNGGPVTAMIDTRALMTYGTGITFETDDTTITDERGRTVDEWLDAQMGDWVDLHMIDAGVQTYWAGDAWPEIVETQAGDFSHVELIDPTTVDVSWDAHGEFTKLQQKIDGPNGQPKSQSLDEAMVGHYTATSATGGPLGESLVEQNRDEIERFARNQAQRANAIKLHGSPKYDVSVGSEDQSIPDRLMRLIRNKFKSTNVDEKTSWVHGGQIDIETLDSPGFEGMGQITETDIAMLASSFRVPLEWLNFGSDGLGSGAPAESRLVAFERQARAEQKRRSQQFKREIVRPVLERYSPFPRDIDVQIQFGDVVSDQDSIASVMQKFPWAFHRDEIRERLDFQPWDDDADKEAPPELAPSAGDTGGAPAETPPAGGPSGIFAEGSSSRAVADGAGRTLFHNDISDSDLSREELVWGEVIEYALWTDDSSRQLFEFDPEEVPEFVKERLRDAIPDAISEARITSLTSAQEGRLKQVMVDSLDAQHGWSIDSVRDNILEMANDLDRHEAERLARDLTQSAVAKGREAGYREQFDVDDEQFYWVGPDDHRETEACEYLKAETNPQHGGTPVALDALRDLVEEANRRFVDHDSREWSPHIQCRHTYVRHVE